MRCPNDEATLVMSERSGIEIDYCPECRGVWLDRGELDKIIERSESMQQPVAPAPQAPAPQAPAPQYDRYDERYGDRRGDRREHHYAPQQQGYYKKRKKESWLSELFD
jgi:Zn-finger nucleic acid-binding protein